MAQMCLFTASASEGGQRFTRRSAINRFTFFIDAQCVSQTSNPQILLPTRPFRTFPQAWLSRLSAPPRRKSDRFVAPLSQSGENVCASQLELTLFDVSVGGGVWVYL